MPIRVLIADDHSVVRQGLRAFLEGDRGLDLVGEARDWAETLPRLGPMRMVGDEHDGTRDAQRQRIQGWRRTAWVIHAGWSCDTYPRDCSRWSGVPVGGRLRAPGAYPDYPAVAVRPERVRLQSRPVCSVNALRFSSVASTQFTSTGSTT